MENNPILNNNNTRRKRRRRLRRHHWEDIIYLVLGTIALIWLLLGVYLIMRYSLQQEEQKQPSQSLLRSAAKFKPFIPNYPTISRDASLESAIIEMCQRTLWHTLETTTVVLPQEETFVFTGDLDDLWIRDSAAQVHPLLVGPVPLVKRDAILERVVAGLIKRVAWYIRHDPYANAFRIDDTYVFSQAQKEMGRHDCISTWNYELDSGCYYIRMLYYFYKAFPQHKVLLLDRVREAVEIMVDLWIALQNHEQNVFPEGPLFDCQNCKGPFRYPGLPRNGKGSETKYTGMTWTGFRPSDDECQYGYLVPANMFCVVVLGYVVEMTDSLWPSSLTLKKKAQRLARDIQQGIEEFGIVQHETFGRIYAYEVDGLGNALLMDDANVPSLLSIPYLNYPFDQQVYENTKRFIHSSDNPTYQKGTTSDGLQVEGYGSPHMSERIKKNIWPMSLAVRGLASASDKEKMEMLNLLSQTTGSTGWMHESFDVHNPSKFTRSWFCWADALYAELAMSMTDACPGEHLTYKIWDWRDTDLAPPRIFSN